MEVTSTSFEPTLLTILEHVADAAFVSFDLELSGVPGKRDKKAGKLTLEQRYQEIKEAASRYTILQIGLTCVSEDVISTPPKYVLRPYNFNLSPLTDERSLGIERIWSYQSGAVEFLLNHEFDLQAPLIFGVPYLSRDEASHAKTLAYERIEKKDIPDVHLEVHEVESLQFVDSVRSSVNLWINTGKAYPGAKAEAEALYIDRKTPFTPPVKGEITELSRFEKRLVHQLIRAEYPAYVTISRAGGIRIIRLDEAREEEYRKQKRQRAKDDIARQTGFRWIIEALAGGDLSGIDVRNFARDPTTGEAVFADIDYLRSRLRRVTDALMRKRPVMVGHNCITDVVYIYATFIGPLPPTLAEFQHALHTLFPVIVDTKYLATHKCGDINPMSSLEDVEAKLRSQPKPVLEVAEGFNKYDDLEAPHEAGYDALITANVAIRLSAKLDAEGRWKEDLPLPMPVTLEDESGGVSLTRAATGIITTAANSITSVIAPSLWSSRNGESVQHPTSRFAHNNVFDQFDQLSINANGAPSTTYDAYESGNARSSIDAVGNWDQDVSPVDGDAAMDGTFDERETLEPMTLMPRFGTNFWRVYGNKLRAFGTMESICPLD